jgi:nitroimidazol reductase NimA-like FMN-containing flavoprotein (pyridoxamine 5'-phosphate oxidase superfamily)
MAVRRLTSSHLWSVSVGAPSQGRIGSIAASPDAREGTAREADLEPGCPIDRGVEAKMPTEIPLDRNGLEILSHDDCLRLLASVKIGRVAMATDTMPIVLPVTFALDGTRVVFCSTPGTKLYVALNNAVVAFEADDVDPDLRFGWSVCLTGPARILSEDADVARARTLGLQQWANLEDPAYIAIDGQLITGRRVRR